MYMGNMSTRVSEKCLDGSIRKYVGNMFRCEYVKVCTEDVWEYQ